MKKRIGFILAMIFLLQSYTSLNVSASNSATSIYIDGVPVVFTNDSGYPFINNEGRTMVPLRVTMESFGAEVSWENNCATIRKDTTTVRCVVGEKNIYRNNVKIENDVAAANINSRVYLPIRAVLEAFGATVEWDGTVKVTSPQVGSLIYSIEHNKSVTKNYWGIWNTALAQKNSGNYREAINTIMSISSVFIAENPGASSAMLYKHLGECYSNLKEYTNASACFKREAYYWSLTPGMEQSVIDANRRSNLIKTNTQIYVKTTDRSMSSSKYFGVKHEPMDGILLGVYAEGDTNIYNPYDPSKFYMDTFPALLGKDVDSYLLYVPYGESVSIYDSHIQHAIEKNKIIQFSLEPRQGLHVVNNYDGYLIRFAQELEERAQNGKFVFRFAGEMNDPTSLWYDSNPQNFIDKFRIVADIMHTYAPSVPVIWAPNFFPSETIDSYYPGDEYVDYVGISSYEIHTPVTDPLGQGVDRSRWSNQLDYIYSHYGHKKPIIIVESGASYMDYDTYANVTPFATSQIEDFFKYLPIKYPNIKMCYIFDSDRERFKFSLSNNSDYLNGFRNGITSDLFICNHAASEYRYSYYEIGNNVKVKAEPTELCSYITTPENNIAYVTYSIDSVYLGVSYGAPYSVNVDFTSYKGRKIEVSVTSFDYSHTPIATHSVNINVI